MSVVLIYTDGACSGNPGLGGWGAVIVYKELLQELAGSVLDTTNNRMELFAVIASLERLKKGLHIMLHTDSKYVFEGCSLYLDKWVQAQWCTANNQAVKNKDLWQRVLDLKKQHNIVWRWVKGHAGNMYNERAHNLASIALAQHKALLV